MKKLFLLIPALVLSLFANAKEIEISSETSNIIHYTIAASTTNDGDVIVLTDEGPYVNSKANYDDYTKISKNVTIKAADGIHPVIKFEVPIQARDGKAGKFIGIKFDGSSLQYDHFIYFKDGNDNELEFEDCEFYNSAKFIVNVPSSTKAKSLVFKNCKFYDNTTNRGILNQGNIGHLGVYDCEFSGFVKDVIDGYSGTSHVDSCIVKNSYFHNHSRSAIFFEASSVDGQQTCDKLVVKNSTFANINGTGDYHSVIDIRPYPAANAIKVEVDHCTFYNNKSINSDHANIRTANISDVTVSNCIFAHSEAYARRATYCTGGGNINNCLTFNYTADGTKGHAYGCTVNAASSVADPLFNDLANNKYTYAGDWTTMELSPARGAATDGTDLGDPRWYSAEVLPSVDFALPYQLVGAKALLSGNIWYDDVNEYLYGEGGSNKYYGTATWKFHAEKAGIFGIAANLNSGNTSGHKLRVEVLDADDNSVDEFAEAASTLPGTLVIPAVGDYKVILHDDQTWSSAKIDNVTLSYIGGAVQAMPGTTNIDEAWFSSNGTRTAGEKIVIPAGHQHEGWVKWNVSFANAANYKAKVNINSGNGHNYTVALYEDENDLTPITWGEGGQTENESPLDLGEKEVPAGNYILKVTNAVQYSDAELVSIQFVNAGGGLVNIPGNITLTEAILSSRAYIDENGEIRFTDDDHAGHILEESVAWRVNVSKAGYYKFTTSVNSTNGHSYLVSIYNADETVLKGSVIQSGDDIWGAPKTFSTDNIYLEEGEYRVKVQNTTKDSKGRIVSISASYEGGAVVNIPNAAIPLADAIVTSGTTRSESEINFLGHTEEYAMWNIQAEEGLYTFTINITGTNHSKMELTVIDSEDNELYKKNLGVSGSGAAVHSGIFMPSGEYVIKVANVNPSADGCVNSISAALTENVIILDETVDFMDQLIAADGQARKPVIKREFKGGMYNTICVPFNVSSNSELEGIFGVGYELLEMTEATISGNELTLNFALPANNIAYGRPYLIKPAQDVKNPVFNSHTIQKSTSHLIVEGDGADFIGNLIADEVPAGDQNLFLGLNNKLYFSQSATPIKGMRAYFHVKVPGAAQAIKHARIVTGTQVVTAIDLVDVDNNTIKLIENGQVIIIRDGIRYNVMGIKLQ